MSGLRIWGVIYVLVGVWCFHHTLNKHRNMRMSSCAMNASDQTWHLQTETLPCLSGQEQFQTIYLIHILFSIIGYSNTNITPSPIHAGPFSWITVISQTFLLFDMIDCWMRGLTRISSVHLPKCSLEESWKIAEDLMVWRLWHLNTLSEVWTCAVGLQACKCGLDTVGVLSSIKHLHARIRDTESFSPTDYVQRIPQTLHVWAFMLCVHKARWVDVLSRDASFTAWWFD